MIKNSKKKSEKSIIKAAGSVLFAVIASSHHWLHTLLIALGLTTLGTGLLAMPTGLKAILLLLSLIFSVWFIIVSRRKWTSDRPAAVVYLVSSIISIVLVVTAIPQIIAPNNGSAPAQQVEQRQTDEHGH